MRKRLIPVLIALGLVALITYQLLGQGQTECKVCVVFKEQRRCATARGPDRAKASEEAHRSACSRMTAGVTEAFACPKVVPDEVVCGRSL
ncbi:MAG TPA: hypothetical protein VGG33_16705 [Polyangia bacterium]